MNFHISILSVFTGGGLVSNSNLIGVHVVTPLKLRGRTEEVLVNRGWVSMKQKKEGDIAQPEGTIKKLIVPFLYKACCYLQTKLPGIVKVQYVSFIFISLRNIAIQTGVVTSQYRMR